MSRRFRMLLATAALTALAGVAAAQAATEQQVFTGEIEGQLDTSVRMKTGATTEFHIKVFTVHDFAVECKGDDGTVKRATLKGRIGIGNEGGFHARDDNGTSTFNVRGKIEGRRAEGVFRLSGKIETTTGETQKCDSGQLDWSAHASAS